MIEMFEKLMSQEFMTEAHGEVIISAIENKTSIIVSGHKGWGILPLLATIGTVAKKNNDVLQVKDESSLGVETDYFMITKPKVDDYEALIAQAIKVAETPMIAVKDPDHPFSLLKLVKSIYKENGDTSKKYLIVECAKENDVKMIGKLTAIELNDNGKTIKTVL